MLYVATSDGVNVYTYPRDTLLGSLGSAGVDVCNDRRGDVFVSSGFAETISEYAHGAAVPKVTLSDPLYAGPCSVDPLTGSVAVVAFYTNPIVIFPYNKRSGWRFAKTLRISGLEIARFCGYDPHGNLFIDGTTSGTGTFALYELPKGRATFELISLDQSISGPGGVQVGRTVPHHCRWGPQFAKPHGDLSVRS